MYVFRYSTEVDIFEYLKMYRASLSRGNTRAGFESATVFSPLKELSSLNKLTMPLSTVRYGDTNQTGLLLT
jgi:hypothetical protein